MHTDIINIIKEDFEAFADPGITPEIEPGAALWEQGGRARTCEFVQEKTYLLPNVKHNGEVLPYREFLASSSMANLSSLANFIGNTELSPNFIDTTAQLQGVEEAAGDPEGARSLIDRRATEELPHMSTRVLLVQGEAGTGKTSSLKQLAVSQAQRYLDKPALPLYFYVNAQGRALSRLEDAMAKDLQDLRSQFSYAAVASLTRHGLLIPIVDGFDELLGSGGYEEAFSSLAAFLSQLNGRGCIIASARSSFFDYRNFRKNATRFENSSYQVDTIQIRPWDPDQVVEYVRNEAHLRDQEPEQVLLRFAKLRALLSEADVKLLSKPFYVARVADLVINQDSLPRSQALLDQLIELFLAREHKKLLDRDGHPLLSVEGHHKFLAELAEEMWWQESKRIDIDTVQTAAGMITEDLKLAPSVIQQIVEKVSSYAFLTTETSERQTYRFEHEVYYGYFLATSLARMIVKGGDSLRQFLPRAVIDDVLAQHTARWLVQKAESISTVIGNLSAAVGASFIDYMARENAGKIIAEIIRQTDKVEDEVLVRNMVFQKVNFGKCILRRYVFENCTFSEVDLTSAHLIECSFQNCQLDRIIVREGGTKLDGLSRGVAQRVNSLIVQQGGDMTHHGSLYNPAQIVSFLGRLGAKIKNEGKTPEYSRRIQTKVDILVRFLRKMELRYHVSKSDLKRFYFARLPGWTEVERQLRQHQLLIDETVQKSGHSLTLMRLTVLPDEIRRGENDSAGSVPD
ncbi:MAG: NACHT domain-containing protein, partial [Rhodothermaceae bacterium]|nr:NACHT domain-containing protein [Rhodothermaceae bacterium]